MYKVLITTSGKGSRLGELTEHINSSLIRLAKKPVLAHIIESYPKDVELVIAVRHLAEQVKEFVKIVYPERKITFSEESEVLPEGESFSLLRSMLFAKEHLQCPFIFHAGDTVVREPILDPSEKNWVGGFKGAPNANYRSYIELDDKVLSFRDKGSTDFDFLHIGLVGVKDYEKFWQAAENLHQSEKNNPSLGDVPVLSELIKAGIEFRPQEFKTWLDLGNLEALYQARKTLGDYLVNLDKPEEATYIFDEDFVVKFMANSQSVERRSVRAKELNSLVPAVEASGKFFLRYKYAKGRLYSRVVTPVDFKNLLSFLKTKLWLKKQEVSQAEFEKICLKFYKDKTLERVAEFGKITGIKDEPAIINGEQIPALSEVLKALDFGFLSQGVQTGFHGDCILDNIIKTPDGYVLLDWRQDFGGLLKSGDWYYDLAKLNHNLTVNHDIVFKDLFSVKVRGQVVNCDIMRSENLVASQKILWDFIEANGLDLKKVQLLTAIAWLNMSPLHHHPYNYFLYYFGRLNLHKVLTDNEFNS